MLLLIEEILDQEGFLISMHEYRRIDVRVSEDHWLEIQGEAAAEEGITVISEITEIAREERRSMVQKIYQSGKHFSPQNFLIKIYGRQNQSLQGEMRVDETKIYFRSGMELVRLMHQWLKVNMERHKTEKTEDGKV